MGNVDLTLCRLMDPLGFVFHHDRILEVNTKSMVLTSALPAFYSTSQMGYYYPVHTCTSTFIIDYTCTFFKWLD